MRSWSRTAHRGNGCIGTLESGDRARALRDASYGRDAHEQRLSQTRREGTHGAPRRARRCRRVRLRKQPLRDSNSFVERKAEAPSPWPPIEVAVSRGRPFIRRRVRTRTRRHLACDYGVYHDRYQRTPDGWKFTERVYEVGTRP